MFQRVIAAVSRFSPQCAVALVVVGTEWAQQIAHHNNVAVHLIMDRPAACFRKPAPVDRFFNALGATAAERAFPSRAFRHRAQTGHEPNCRRVLGGFAPGYRRFRHAWRKMGVLLSDADNRDRDGVDGGKRQCSGMCGDCVMHASAHLGG